jgi:endonuclease/exonuclease/phosphatase family metal-dependent hydrolase
VLLQEVDEGAPRSRELNLARELAQAMRLEHFALGHNVSLRKGRYGNATLSRWPILRERNIDLTIGRRKRRGCQHTTIQLGGESWLEVFNLHLGLSARERRQQVGLLVSSQEFAELDPGRPAVVGGDFNDWLSELRPLFVAALGFTCATDRHTHRGPRAIPTYPSFSPSGGLDRLYFRGEVSLCGVFPCRHRAARMASDHLPVFAELDLEPAAPGHRVGGSSR